TKEIPRSKLQTAALRAWNWSFSGVWSFFGVWDLVFRSLTSRASVPEQFFQLLARGGFPGIVLPYGNEYAPGEIEVFAEIAEVLLIHRFRPSVATLMRRPEVVAQAIQADPQVGTALRTTFAASRLPGQCPFPSTFPAMARHGPECNKSPLPGNPPNFVIRPGSGRQPRRHRSRCLPSSKRPSPHPWQADELSPRCRARRVAARCW